MITHTSNSHQIPCYKKTVKVTSSKNLPKILFCNNPYMHHTSWSCLIGCANMKWFRQVLWKIQSGHDFVHRRMGGQRDGQTDRRTDGQMDGRRETSIPPFQLRWSDGYKNDVYIYISLYPVWMNEILWQWYSLVWWWHSLMSCYCLWKWKWQQYITEEIISSQNTQIFSQI